jgi:hypothetical protein
MAYAIIIVLMTLLLGVVFIWLLAIKPTTYNTANFKETFHEDVQ